MALLASASTSLLLVHRGQCVERAQESKCGAVSRRDRRNAQGLRPAKRVGRRTVVNVSGQVSTAAADDPRAGVEVYQPQTFNALVNDAARAVLFALSDKVNKMEVEFPPLPSSVSGYKGSSDDFIDANLRLALAMAQRLHTQQNLKVKLVLPDKPERRRASRILNSALELMRIDAEPPITLGSLDDAPGTGGGILGSVRSILDFDFAGGSETSWSSSTPPDVFVVLNASTTELPTVEKYLDHYASVTPAILFNLELDTLRSDLGLFGFPSKDVHYRFLSAFKPVFYIRTRDYSKSIPVSPFIINYSGALLRIYPGPWQVMLRQSDGSLVCVAEGPDRFPLGQVKEELLLSLGLQEEKGSALEFLRRGYKTTTWWEEDANLENSSAWRR